MKLDPGQTMRLRQSFEGDTEPNEALRNLVGRKQSSTG